MKIKGFYKSTLLIVIFIFTSCVKDDLKDCQQDMSIRFDYTLNSAYKDLFAEKINSLDLLIYNADNQLVSTYRELQSNLESGNTLPIHNLPNDSSYTFVACANIVKEHYDVNYASTIEDMCVSYKHSTDANPMADSFFHGSIVATMQEIKGGQPLILSLTNNTHLVRVLIEETHTIRPIDLTEYKVELSGTNGIYNFENKTVGTDLLRYKPTYKFPQAHAITIDFNCLRVMKEGDLTLKVYGHNSELLYNELLVDLLYQSDEFVTQEDLDRVGEFNLKFEVKRDDAIIGIDLVGINDWNCVNQSDGF